MARILTTTLLCAALLCCSMSSAMAQDFDAEAEAANVPLAQVLSELTPEQMHEMHEQAEMIRAAQRAAQDGAGSTGEEEEEVGEGLLVGGSEVGALPASGDPGVKWETGSEAPRFEATADAPQRVRRMSKRMADQVELMREALRRGLDTTLSDDDRLDGLEALQELVEDMDNARDFATIGGFQSVLELLQRAEGVGHELQETSAWVIGTAAQNHPEVQEHLDGLGALPTLASLLRSHPSAAVRTKAVFALSGMVRGCDACADAFVAAQGAQAVLGALSDAAPRVARKALVLVADLANEARLVEPLAQAMSAGDFCAAALRHLGDNASDLDATQKALEALVALRKSSQLAATLTSCEYQPAVRALQQELGARQRSGEHSPEDWPELHEALLAASVNVIKTEL